MDKKMRKVTKKIRKAETILKKAEKENKRLADYDQRVRDPLIEKCKKKGGLVLIDMHWVIKMVNKIASKFFKSKQDTKK